MDKLFEEMKLLLQVKRDANWVVQVFDQFNETGHVPKDASGKALLAAVNRLRAKIAEVDHYNTTDGGN